VTEWQVGQKAVISRRLVVTITHVTPTGRVTANGRTFDKDGRERSGGDPWRRPKIEPLTPEIQAEMDLETRGNKARKDAYTALAAAEKWMRSTSGGLGRYIPELADVERTERLAAAIHGVLQQVEGSP
jgi:hypothetical protein